MPALAEIQSLITMALVQGDRQALVPVLSGGARAASRVAIHERHYTASLVRALHDRFPATVWLVGSELVTDAATSFIREQPPSKPCIAEYGETFPQHLSAHPAAASLPYLQQFAELEWHLGRLALATEDSPNVHYLHLHWSLDELIGVYLADSVPDTFALRAEDVWLAIRGLRGTLEMERLVMEEFLRRSAAQTEGDGR
jgi:putative DNA-binding protein